jgi:hypothetical protein
VPPNAGGGTTLNMDVKGVRAAYTLGEPSHPKWTCGRRLAESVGRLHAFSIKFQRRATRRQASNPLGGFDLSVLWTNLV